MAPIPPLTGLNIYRTFLDVVLAYRVSEVMFNDYLFDIQSVSGLSEHYHTMPLNNNHSSKAIHIEAANP